MNVSKPFVKMLYIIPSLITGGAEFQLLTLIQGLLAKQIPCEIRILTMIEKGALAEKFEKNGIIVDCLGISPGNSLSNLVNVFRYIRRYRPHIIHTNLWHADKFGQLAAFLINVPYRLSTIHNYETTITRKQLLWSRVWSRLATGIISVSSSIKYLWITERKLPAEKIKVIYNSSSFIPPKRIMPRTKCQTHVKLLSLGRVDEQKGVIYSIMAVKELLQDFPGIALDIYGPSYKQDYRQMLDEYIMANNISHSVSFKGVTTNPKDHYQRYHVLLLSSLWEGFHIVAIEAMSCGIPIVATDIDVHQEIFDGGRCALLVSVKKPDEMAAAVKKLINDPVLYRRLSQQGRERSKIFSREKMVDAYYDYYMRIINKLNDDRK